jgi:hypothetical protein
MLHFSGEKLQHKTQKNNGNDRPNCRPYLYHRRNSIINQFVMLKKSLPPEIGELPPSVLLMIISS